MSAENRGKRVLVIGIDGGTWTVLRPAMERGYMPFLKRLVETGASGVLMSTIPALTPPAWASFQTGCNPGKTGVFCFTLLDRATRKNTFVSAEMLRETLWEAAGNAGRRVVVLNLPMSYPPKPINGCMVTGLMTPSMRSEFTHPKELKAELLKAVPGYHIFNMEGVRDVPVPQDIPGFIGRMAEVLENRTLAAEYLIRTREPDLCMVHFQTPDVIQHALWCYLDRHHAHYDSDKHTYILEHFYSQLDKCMERVYQAYHRCAGDFITFAVSDHGFEAYTHRFNLATWLYKQGFLVPDKRSQRPPWPKRITQALRIGRALRRFVSPRSMARLEDRLAMTPDVIDWQKSSVYVTSFSSEAGIYIMEPDSARQASIARRISEGLRALKDPGTGRPMVEAVHRREEIYHGPGLALMPDLIAIPAPGFMCNSVCRMDGPLVEEVDPEKEFVVGRHHREGIIAACGGGIAEKIGVRADIIDAAPTILYCMGLAIPENCDGGVVASLFTEDFLAARGTPRISGQKTSVTAGIAEPVYSAEDEREIQQKLRDLGYM